MQVKLVLYVEQEKQHVGANIGVNVGANVGVNTIEDINQNLTERQCEILKLLSNDSSLTAGRMAQALSVTPRTVERNISVLRKYGVLRREGSDKSGHWVVQVNSRKQ